MEIKMPDFLNSPLPYDVLIDTNIYEKYRFNPNHEVLKRLLKYDQIGLITLHTSQIIIEESRLHLTQELSTQKDRALNAINTLNRIGCLEINDEERLHERINEYEKRRLNNLDWYFNQQHKLPYDFTVDDLFRQYFLCKAPFEERKKSEFPDAAIITSIRKYIDKRKELSSLHRTANKFCVITSDQGWFKAFENQSNVELFEDPKDFLQFCKKNVAYSSAFELPSDIELEALAIEYIRPKLEKAIKHWLDLEMPYWLNDEDDENGLHMNRFKMTHFSEPSLEIMGYSEIEDSPNSLIVSLCGNIEVQVEYDCGNYNGYYYDFKKKECYNYLDFEGECSVGLELWVDLRLNLTENKDVNAKLHKFWIEDSYELISDSRPDMDGLEYIPEWDGFDLYD